MREYICTCIFWPGEWGTNQPGSQKHGGKKSREQGAEELRGRPLMIWGGHKIEKKNSKAILQEKNLKGLPPGKKITTPSQRKTNLRYFPPRKKNFKLFFDWYNYKETKFQSHPLEKNFKRPSRENQKFKRPCRGKKN